MGCRAASLLAAALAFLTCIVFVSSSKLPNGISGFYCLIADDTVVNYTSTSVWTPRFYDYQLTGTNVVFLTFINPALLPAVPPAMTTLGKCKGQKGCSPSGTLVIFSVGGESYSNQQWPFLATREAAEAMAQHVAQWSALHGADGIDIDIEGTAGSSAQAAANLQAFASKLRQLNPSLIVTLPVYGYPQIAAENQMVNSGFTNASGSWKSTGLVDTVGIMVYQDLEAFQYVKDYANGTGQWDGFPITVNVPTPHIMVGVQGGASPATVKALAAAVVTNKVRGFMVWFASVFDATRNQSALQYGSFGDASTTKSSSWAKALEVIDPSTKKRLRK